MSKSQTRTKRTVTHLGEVEYDTVWCASCGQEAIRENARRVVTGKLQKKKSWAMLGKVEYEFDSRDYDEAWVCDYCHEDAGFLGLKLGHRHTITIDEKTSIWWLLGTITAIMFVVYLIGVVI